MKKEVGRVGFGRFGENGRSMVEMLGVLAIIGVMSVGAVFGLRYAFDKYTANQTIKDIHTRALMCSGQLESGRNSCDLGDFDKKTQSGYVVTQSIADSANRFYLTIADVPEGVCRKIAASGWTLPLMYAGAVSTTPMTSDNCAEITDITFMFSADLQPLQDEQGCLENESAICPNGSGKNCQGNYISGYCGCRRCFSCEGYLGESYHNNCPMGQRCAASGCVCESGGCPAGQSSTCPDGAQWVAGGLDNCNNQCYTCVQDTGGECTPACPAGSGIECSGAVVSGGTCGATGCKTCFACEGYLGGNYFSTCGNKAQCTANGCSCSEGTCPEGTSRTCETGQVKKFVSTDECGLACYSCEVDACSGKCKNGSTCLGDLSCYCFNGWSGDDCGTCAGTVYGEHCCLEGQVWNEVAQKCVSINCTDGIVNADGSCANGLCTDNSNCSTGEYCQYSPVSWGDKGTYGTCEKIGTILSYNYTEKDDETNKTILFTYSYIPNDWWSSLNWCEAQGLRLASRGEICEGGITTSSCQASKTRIALANNFFNSIAWMRDGSSTDKAYYIYFATGEVKVHVKSTDYEHPGALCRN